MKAECIDNTGYKNELTLGKVYDVLIEHKTMYVINDYGQIADFASTRFKLITAPDWIEVEYGLRIAVDNIGGWSPDVKTHKIYIYLKTPIWLANADEFCYLFCVQDADTFATFVGYDWS